MLRIVSICGVVAIHTFSFVVSNPNARGGLSWNLAVAIDLGFVWAVPVFVMLSGALILKPSAYAHGTAAFYRKRLSRIIPAFVAWHLIYLFAIRGYVNGAPPSLNELVQLVVDGKVYTQLYFLWIILGLYLVAPVIAGYLEKSPYRRGLSLGVCALVWTTAVFTMPVTLRTLGIERPVSVTVLTLWLPYAGLFVLGYALTLKPFGRVLTMVSIGVAILLGALTIAQYSSPESFATLNAVSPVSYYSATVSLLSIAVFLAFIGLLQRWTPKARTQRALTTLSDASFGVFLLHLALIAIVGRLFPFATSGASLPLTAAVYIVIVVASFTLTILARRVPYLRAIF